MKQGKRVSEWAGDRAKLKKIYEEKGIIQCEANLEGCLHNWILGFHHKRKRVEYIKYPEKLGEFSETILVCQSCHDILESNRKLTEEMFKKLR